MGTTDEVTTLALAAGGGDRAALSEFIRLTQDDVWRFVARMSDAAAADDLTQETYVRMLGALASFEGRSSARTWLLAIARRVVVDQFRHDRVRPVTAGGDALELAGRLVIDSPDPAAGIRVEETLNLLEPDRREALVLTRLLGFSYQEAAEIVGCPVGTIRSRVARARTDLVAALAAQELELSGL